MKNYRSLLLSLLLISLLVTLPYAGVLIKSTQTVYGLQPQKLTTSLYLERDRVRIDTKGPVEEQVIIFRKDRGLYWVIDNKEGTYMEMTRADMQKMKARISEQMAKAREMMQEQLKQMPPEQRQMMEEMMKGRIEQNQMPAQKGVSMEKEKPLYKKVASGEKVNRWTCDRYVGYRNGEKVEEVWTVNPRFLGISPHDFQVLKDFSEFAQNMLGGESESFSLDIKTIEEEQGYPGFPVKTIHYSGETVEDVEEVLEVHPQEFSSSLFELPAGLQKQNPWDMMPEYR